MKRLIVSKRINHDTSVTFDVRWWVRRKEIRLKATRTPKKPTKTQILEARDEAYVIAARIRYDLARTPIDQNIPSIKRTVAQARDEYLLWCQSLGLSGFTNNASSTAKNKLRALNAFIYYVNTNEQRRRVKTIDRVVRWHVATWRDKLIQGGLMVSTVITMVSVIRSWLKWAVDHGYCVSNPCDKLAKMRLPKGRADSIYTNPATMRLSLYELIQAMPDERRGDIVLLLACTGLRQGEAKQLEWQHWDEDNAILNVPYGIAETTKRHGRTIPLCDQAQQALVRLRSDGMGDLILGTRRGSKLTSQLGKWLALGNAKPHDMRKFFITALETIGAPTNVVDDLAGHVPSDVRAAYTPESNVEAARPWIVTFGQWLGD